MVGEPTVPCREALPAKPRSAAMALRGPLTTPRWYPNARAPKLAMLTAHRTGVSEAGSGESDRFAVAALQATGE